MDARVGALVAANPWGGMTCQQIVDTMPMPASHAAVLKRCREGMEVQLYAGGFGYSLRHVIRPSLRKPIGMDDAGEQLGLPGRLYRRDMGREAEIDELLVQRNLALVVGVLQIAEASLYQSLMQAMPP